LVRLRRVGDVAAKAANESVVFDARVMCGVSRCSLLIRAGVHCYPAVGWFRAALYSRNACVKRPSWCAFAQCPAPILHGLVAWVGEICAQHAAPCAGYPRESE